VSNEDLIALIPVRSFRTGKSRLSPAIDDATRADLIRRMLNQTLQAATHAGVFSRIAVVSLDAEVLVWLATRWPSVIPIQQSELDPGLIPALELGRTNAAEGESDGYAILFPDLPVIQPSDLQALVRPTSQIVIAPDQTGTGTNALLIRRQPVDAGSFALQFGVESFPRHLTESRRLGIEPAIVSTAGLAYDLDTPAHFAALQSSSTPIISDTNRTGS
jgi:2-phospho-L-lactate guanylyltransferase